MKFENWSPEKDKLLKKREIEIHDKYHKIRTDKIKGVWHLIGQEHRVFRIESLKKALKKAGVTLNGKILEVGAGDGWCSAYVLKNFSEVEQIYTMEINDAAVEELIPKSFKVLDVDESKVTIVKGSFNAIPLENHFNYVLSMGAIHHSSNLYVTLKNIFKTLKPGGWFIAQEPYMKNSTLNSFYHERENQSVNFKGILDVKNSERTDLFYRECEYRTAGFHVGFDFFSDRVVKDSEILKKGFFKKTEIPPEHLDKPNNMIIYAQKPLSQHDDIPVTSWEESLK